MYRFRSVENLIGKYQELERQQIYFADLEQLNDPLEGKRRYFWKGDKIIWENFLKHYLLCLEHVVSLCRILPNDQSFKQKDIPIFMSAKNLRTDIHRERIRKTNNKFFSSDFVLSYMQFLIKNPKKIYAEEMYVHLKVLSGIAIESIFEIEYQSELIPENQRINVIEPKFEVNADEVWEEFNKDPDSEAYNQIMDFLFEYLKSIDSGELLIKYKDFPKVQSLYADFPQMYLDSIIELVYPKAYVACFMDNCLNSSIWGTYGNNHTGVCLKFKTKDELKPVLPLKTIISSSTLGGNSYGFRDFPLQQIEYCSNFEELDFFRNIGRLSKAQLIEQWYTDENGDFSICSEDIFTNEEVWRKKYWDQFDKAYLKKLPDWSQENEYRIIMNDFLRMHEDKNERLIEYRFEDLEAIIFGMRTPREAKLEIIEIVKRKCDEIGRKSFDLFEMDYSIEKKGFYQREIPYLKE